jgi:hypothetical protein
MGQVFKKYWTNVSKKPKGFKFVKRNVYEYEVNVIGYTSKTSISKSENFNCKEIIPTHYYIDESSCRNVNEEKFYETISKIIGIELTNDNSLIKIDFFTRDGLPFEFVEHIEIWDIKTSIKYLEMKQLRERANKIKNIKKRL